MTALKSFEYYGRLVSLYGGAYILHHRAQTAALTFVSVDP